MEIISKRGKTNISGKKGFQITDITGKTFHNLTAIRRIGKTKKGYSIWLFQCKCGNQKQLNMSDVTKTNNGTKSCGCLNKNKNTDDTAINCILSVYKKGARNRNLKWQISRNEFIKLISDNCHYCNIKQSNNYKVYHKDKIHEYFYNGIDRINNKLGYEISNCVSCCSTCNTMKMDLSHTDFLIKIKLIYNKLVEPK